MRKWISLILANLIAVMVLIYFMDFFGYVKIYTDLKEKIIGLEVIDNVPTEEERRLEIELAAAEDQKKIEEFLNQKEATLLSLEAELKLKEEELAQERLSLTTERESLLMREEKIREEAETAESYDLRVSNLATRFYDMPPQLAAERILALEDDLLIIDVLGSMDVEAQRRGQQSIVPFLFSLMPPPDAARIMKKSTVSL